MVAGKSGRMVEDEAIVVATDYNNRLRTDTTVQQALAAIDATEVVLLLPNEGDGIWTFTDPVITPANVLVLIPNGVFVDGPGLFTINGRLLAMHEDWYIGSAAVVLTSDHALQVNALRTQALDVGAGIMRTAVFSYDVPADAGAATIEAVGVQLIGYELQAAMLHVLTTFGTTQGLVTLALGDRNNGQLAETRWATGIAIEAPTATTAADWEGGVKPVAKTANGDLVVTAQGGLFDATGLVRITAVYNSYVSL